MTVTGSAGICLERLPGPLLIPATVDASVIALVERLNSTTVVTLDRRDVTSEPGARWVRTRASRITLLSVKLGKQAGRKDTAMARRDSVEVAEVLAQLAKLEQDALDNVARAEEFSDDEHGQRRFSEGEVSALRGAQKLIRELADWPVTEAPLLADWPPPEAPSDQPRG